MLKICYNRPKWQRLVETRDCQKFLGFFGICINQHWGSANTVVAQTQTVQGLGS